MRTISAGLIAAVFAFAWVTSASAQSLNGRIIVDPTCEMSPTNCLPHPNGRYGPVGPVNAPDAAGPVSNDILKRWYRPFR